MPYTIYNITRNGNAISCKGQIVPEPQVMELAVAELRREKRDTEGYGAGFAAGFTAGREAAKGDT